jgi:hypothetical protein
LLEQLNEKEKYYKIFFNSIDKVLNCELNDNGVGPRSKEVKEKIGKAHIGNTYNLGKKRTQNTKEKQSEIAKSQDWRKNVGLKQKNIKKHSDEYIKGMCKKIKDNNTGIIYDSCSKASEYLHISPSLITNSLKKKYKISKWNFSYYE